MEQPSKHTVVIAGGSGFVGRALGQRLGERFRVIGISRAERSGTRAVPGFAEFRRADLFNLRQTEEALRGADFAVYLVHSMLPSARLSQGHFADFDLVCADNFARAAARVGVRQIVYLSGLLPEGDELSPHLRSRAEVERTLGRYGVPVTTLRAGMVLGGGGSSFEMMVRLVERLPAMICPRWTLHRMQPISVHDVIALLAFTVANAQCYGQSFDVGAKDACSYRELMQLTGELLGVHRPMLPLRLFAPSLSRLWVSVVTGAPPALVAPLIASMRHELLARDHRLCELAGHEPLPLRAALSRALDERKQHPGSSFAGAHEPETSRVRSVQRMQLPPGRNAEWAAHEYMRFLPTLLRGLLRVDVDAEGHCRFHWLVIERPLLQLDYAPTRSTPDRQLFFLRDSWLTRPGSLGRFELRQVLDERTLLTAIHDFAPRLPWFLYRFSQALVHGFVMRAFAAHLDRSPAADAEDASTPHNKRSR